MGTSTGLMRKAEQRKYVSAAETRSLLDSSAPARTRRLMAGDMVSPEEAAEAVGVPLATVKGWVDAGRALVLPMFRNKHRLPAWQFAPTIWDAMPHLSEALNCHGPWRLLSFLETPLGGLDGLTPRQALEQGELQRVLALASEEA